MWSVWSVSKLSTESVGSRRELVANCVHTADADATKQFHRIGGVYWALGYIHPNCPDRRRWRLIRWCEHGDTIDQTSTSCSILRQLQHLFC